MSTSLIILQLGVSRVFYEKHDPSRQEQAKLSSSSYYTGFKTHQRNAALRFAVQGYGIPRDSEVLRTPRHIKVGQGALSQGTPQCQRELQPTLPLAMPASYLEVMTKILKTRPTPHLYLESVNKRGCQLSKSHLSQGDATRGISKILAEASQKTTTLEDFHGRQFLRCISARGNSF